MDNPVLYTHYEIELVGMPIDWDITIVDSLEGVMDVLRFVDIHLDDPELPDCHVKIKGIGMSREAFKNWQEEHLGE